MVPGQAWNGIADLLRATAHQLEMVGGAARGRRAAFSLDDDSFDHLVAAPKARGGTFYEERDGRIYVCGIEVRRLS
jgi:hypothetical protein